KQAWNRRTRKWCGVLLAVLVACGLATYYCHVYLETDEDGQDGGDNSALLRSLYQDRAISSPALGSVWREGEACLAPYKARCRSRIHPARGVEEQSDGPALSWSSRSGWQPGWPGGSAARRRSSSF